MAYKTAAEAAKEVRAALKAKGWNRTKVSVRCSNYAGGSSLHVEILSPEVDEAEVQRVAKGEEHVRYCEASGEILSGGNRYVHVGHSRECRAAMGAPHVPDIQIAIRELQGQPKGTLEQVVPGVLLEVDGSGWGRLWVDGQAGMNVHLGGDLLEAGFHVEQGLRRIARAKVQEVREDIAAALEAEQAPAAAQQPAELDAFAAELQGIVAEAFEADQAYVAWTQAACRRCGHARCSSYQGRECANPGCDFPDMDEARLDSVREAWSTGGAPEFEALATGEEGTDESGSVSGRVELVTSAIQHGAPAPKAEKLAARMEKAADSLQRRIDQKRDPAIAHQNLTPRRARIVAGMAKDAEHLEGLQRVLRQLAREVRAGANVEVSMPLRRASYATVAAVEKLVAARHRGPSAPGWESWLHVRSAYEATREPTDDELRRGLERSLVGFEAPGFFPTPRDLADRLVAALDLKPGDRVLEPSAGKGDLVDALLLAEPGLREVVAVELQHELAEVLSAKYAGRTYGKAEPAARAGFVVVLREDFMGLQLQPDFDAVAMNPPFERGQDAAHMLRALRCLRPGGRLAAVTSVGAAFGPKAFAFTSELDALCSSWSIDQLPDDSFKGAKAFRQTGARCALLVATRKA